MRSEILKTRIWYQDYKNQTTSKDTPQNWFLYVFFGGHPENRWPLAILEFWVAPLPKFIRHLEGTNFMLLSALLKQAFTLFNPILLSSCVALIFFRGRAKDLESWTTVMFCVTTLQPWTTLALRPMHSRGHESSHWKIMRFYEEV